MLYEETEFYKQTGYSKARINNESGLLTEYRVFDTFNKKLSGYKKFLLELILPVNDSDTTEVDLVVLHESGILVVEIKKRECKNISGSANEKQLKYTYGETTVPYGNPAFQNASHLKAVKDALVGPFGNNYQSLIVFESEDTDCRLEIKTSDTDAMFIKHEDLPAYLNSDRFHTKCFEQADIDKYYEELRNTSLIQARKDSRAAHINRCKTKYQKSEPADALIPMPEHVENIQNITNNIDTSIINKDLLTKPANQFLGKCPRCNGDVIEKEKLFECKNSEKCCFKIWKDDNKSFKRFWSKKGIEPTAEIITALLNGENVKFDNLYSETKDKTYSANIALDENSSNMGKKSIKYNIAF
jgi:Holliday junction resolvase